MFFQLYGYLCDMRKSFPGLDAPTRLGLLADPLSGDLFVFISLRGNRPDFPPLDLMDTYYLPIN